MKIALLGGSFDPVHLGHLQLGYDILENGHADLVLYIPLSENPFKKEPPLASGLQRIEMLRLALQGSPGFLVEDIEVQRGGKSWTVETVRAIKEKYRPKEKLRLILGSDIADSFPHWRNAEEILNHCDILRVERAGMETLSAGGTDTDFPSTKVQSRAMELSSSEVRARIAKGEPWHHLLHPAVADFIYANGLYGLSGQERIDYRVFERELSTQLSPSRYAHSRASAEYARLLARRFKVDEEKAWFTALAHDIAKEFPLEEALRLVKTSGLEKEFQIDVSEKNIRQNSQFFHTLAGAQWLKEQWNIEDEDILEAVRTHTSGKIGMSALAKIVYIVDKIDFARPSVDTALREASWLLELDDLFALIVEKTVEWLREQGKNLHPLTENLLETLKKRTDND